MSRFRFVQFDLRKPRHPLAKFALGVAGVAVLSLLLVFGLFVGLAMLAAGMIWRIAAQLRAPVEAPNRDGVIEGEYRVVRKRDPMLSR
ncbi:hypothetical protein [Coralloluteibacterium thermophilus]|uniref:Uncharacterized protein n=1 Tax=Coralloluteibacterium thermophilum TaxID=2707049 RepID=A0ABV9NM61_9GAMM